MMRDKVTKGPVRWPSSSTTTAGSAQSHSPVARWRKPQLAGPPLCMSSRSIALRPRRSCLPRESSQQRRSEQRMRAAKVEPPQFPCARSSSKPQGLAPDATSLRSRTA